MKRLLILCVLLVGCQPQPTASNYTPTWTRWPAMRSAPNLPPIVSDIESHLPVGFFPVQNPYRDDDRITWVHEGSHGIAGLLRNNFNRTGFYVLNNRAVLMKEPIGTLSSVASTVPKSLRGSGYKLYLIDQQRYFQDNPTYVFDEWIAYTNGSDARLQLKIASRSETVRSMMEFVPYALCVPYACKDNNVQMKWFIGWQIERALTLQRASGVATNSKLRTAPDAEALRRFTRGYFGPEWTRKTLGF